MARFIPDIHPDDGHYSSERKVLRALGQLDNSYTVFYSFHWLRRIKNNDHFSEGEIDILLLHPFHGVIVLEIKGGHRIKYEFEQFKRYNDESKQWEKLKNPCEQARKNMHAVMNILDEHPNIGRDSIPYGYGVVFPDVIQPSDTYRSALPKEVFLDNQAIKQNNLEQSLEKIAHSFKRIKGFHIQPQTVDRIIQCITPSIEYLPAYGVVVNENKRMQRLMGAMQRNTLNHLKSKNRLIVSGGAGSGKTEIAFSYACEYARAGFKVLFLCFNVGLKESLNYRVSIDPDGSTIQDHLTIETILKFASIEAQSIQLELRSEDIDKDALLNHIIAGYDNPFIDVNPPQYDIILIDEGQDFRAPWLRDIAFWLNKPTEAETNDTEQRANLNRLFVFLDFRQAILDGLSPLLKQFDNPSEQLQELVQAEDWYTLPTNYRNTSNVAALCSGLYQEPGNAMNPIQTVIQYKRISKKSNIYHTELISHIKKLLSTLESPRDLVLLSPSAHGGILSNLTEIDGLPVSKDIASWLRGTCLLKTTARSFKGLEAGIIVIYDIESIDQIVGEDQRFTRGDTYVSCSRATTALHIFATRPVIRHLKSCEEFGNKNK